MLVKQSIRLIFKLSRPRQLGLAWKFSSSEIASPNKNNNLQKYLQPCSLNLSQLPEKPTLSLKSQKYLMKNWWGECPFQIDPYQAMRIPVFSFTNGQYIGKCIDIPQQIFNRPLRRDLIHRLYDFRINLNKFRTKETRDRTMTVGSNRKMRQQKGTGKARMSDKRAPHLRKGGKAHGSKAVVYSYPLNAKIKINALKALLSSKLVEGRIKIIDNQRIQQGKTKILSSILARHIVDERAIFCIITSQDFDQNFELAQRNIRKIIWHTTYSLDVLSLFKADRILITLDGLKELIQSINKTIYVSYRQKHLPKIEDAMGQNSKQESQQKYNPEKPYEFKFKILAQYLQLYKKVQDQSPKLLKEQFKRIRNVETKPA